MDADPHRQVQFICAARVLRPAERPLDRQGGEQCALAVVFLRHRGAEQRHEPIAGKLRRGSSIAVHLGKARGQKRAYKVAHRLGPEPLGERSRTDDVAKQHCDLFHFAGKRNPGRCGGFGYELPARNGFLQTRPVQRHAALAAKPVFGRIARAARRTRDAQRRTTVSAELHPGEIVGAAPRAPHAASTGRRKPEIEIFQPSPLPIVAVKIWRVRACSQFCT